MCRTQHVPNTGAGCAGLCRSYARAWVTAGGHKDSLDCSSHHWTPMAGSSQHFQTDLLILLVSLFPSQSGLGQSSSNWHFQLCSSPQQIPTTTATTAVPRAKKKHQRIHTAFAKELYSCFLRQCCLPAVITNQVVMLEGEICQMFKPEPAARLLSEQVATTSWDSCSHCKTCLAKGCVVTCALHIQCLFLTAIQPLGRRCSYISSETALLIHINLHILIQEQQHSVLSASSGLLWITRQIWLIMPISSP